MVRLKCLSDVPVPNNGLRSQRTIMVAEYFELSNTIWKLYFSRTITLKNLIGYANKNPPGGTHWAHFLLGWPRLFVG